MAHGIVVEQVLEHGAVVAEVGVWGALGRVGDEGLEGEEVGGGAVCWEAEGSDGARGGYGA